MNSIVYIYHQRYSTRFFEKEWSSIQNKGNSTFNPINFLSDYLMTQDKLINRFKPLPLVVVPTGLGIFIMYLQGPGRYQKPVRRYIMSKQFKKLSHTLYECKYHVVCCPKYRYRIFKDEIGEYVKGQIYQLCRQKELVEILELNVREDHIHLVMSIPPKYAVSSVMGYLKGKLAIRLFQRYERLGKRYWGRHLWSRGYCVSTVGLNEKQIREYVKWQEKKEREIEEKQQKLFE